MTKLQFLEAVRQTLIAWRDHGTGESAICDAAYYVAAKYGIREARVWLVEHVSRQLGKLGHSFASIAAFEVVFDHLEVDEVLKYEAGLMTRGPLGTAIRLLWVDQFIHATERALPLPPFPSKEDLLPLFQPWMK